ncbi:hypothetical protein BCR44DRAFT_54585 [Catenaria anguillulae PL171]|uniref:Uncharacterized protein n=1 Tax=Catenaria anguillulae PL171 TaxID=765915 RepID=A0A1Y2HPJ2_9FUNG|nr:hypothetical protein BCR44DRAFT_54585 [Catenaria anguillulae PL171]
MSAASPTRHVHKGINMNTHLASISRLLPSSAVSSVSSSALSASAGAASAGASSQGHSHSHSHSHCVAISASAVSSSTTTVVTASAGSPTLTSSCSASIVSNASASHPHSHPQAQGHGHGHRHTPSISSFNAAACRPLPPPVIQQASPASLKHTHSNHNENHHNHRDIHHPISNTMIPLTTFPSSPSPTAIQPAALQAANAPKFSPSEHPLVIGTGPRWLHFDPDLAPTHIRVSPPIKNAQVKDHDANWQWLLLDPSSASSATPATVSIVPVPPPSGTQVLLAIANPRWYLGSKPSGELFLLNTPTTMTVWTVKLLPNHRDFVLVSTAHSTLLSASDSSLALLPSTPLADLPSAADISPQLASSLPSATVFHAHLIPPHVFDPTRQPLVQPEVQKPQRALIRGNSNASSLHRGGGGGRRAGYPASNRQASPDRRRPNRPGAPLPPSQPQGPPTIITAPVALLTTDKRAICKRPTLASHAAGRRQIVGIAASSAKPTSPTASTTTSVDPMEYYVGKTTRKEVGNAKKNKAELVAFFYVHVAEPKYPPKNKHAPGGEGAHPVAPAATEGNMNLTGATAVGLLSPILSDAVLKPPAAGPPELPPIRVHGHAHKNSMHSMSKQPPAPAHAAPRTPAPATAAQRTPIGFRAGAPLDTAKCAGRKYLLVAADTRNYLALDPMTGRLLEVVPTTNSDTVLWTYHQLPSSPLSLALCHVASGMYLTVSSSSSKFRGQRLAAHADAGAGAGPAMLSSAQALKLYVPPALPQAVNALHARPPPNRMLVFSVALCATSLVSASAAIANALLNYSRTTGHAGGAAPPPSSATKAGQMLETVDAQAGMHYDHDHGQVLATGGEHECQAHGDTLHGDHASQGGQFALSSDWHHNEHAGADHFHGHAHLDHGHFGAEGAATNWWDGGAHDWVGGSGGMDDGGAGMLMGGMFG